MGRRQVTTVAHSRSAGPRPSALFVCPVLDAGGAERHWASLIPALVERGLDARLVAIKTGGRAFQTLRDAGVPARELGGNGLAALFKLPALLAERRARPDVIVTWEFNAHGLGAVFSRLTQTPQIVNWHRGRGSPISARQRQLLRLVARAGAGAIAVSDFQTEELMEFGFPAERIRVVPNGVPAPGPPGLTRVELRQQLRLPVDAFIAVLVARLGPEKRIDRFIEAIAAFQQSEENALGIVVGDGPLAVELERQASHRGAPVRFVGFQEDPSQYMIASDVVCLTSEREALPLTLMEAGACARPSIATDVGGTRRIVEDGKSGFVVPVGDVPAVVNALAVLARRPEDAAAMGRRAYERWQDAFTFDAMVDNYFELLTTAGGPPTRWGIAA